MDVLLLVVGFLWGCTNAYMKKVNKDEKEDDIKERDKGNKKKHLIKEFFSLLNNINILFLFLINQLGSVLYYFLLTKSDISLIMPLANTFAFFFTYITEIFVFRKQITLKSTLGLILVSVGAFLCSFF